MRLLPLSIGLVLLAQGAVACPIEITATQRGGGDSYEVRWTEEPGATRYSVYERRDDEDGFRLLKRIEVTGEPPRFVAHPSSTRTAQYHYLIIAEGANGQACMATKSLEMPGDEKLAEVTHKRIVPFAGSVRGANGSDFRTSLSVRPAVFAKGRIVFRPVGTTPSASDPSIPYEFGSVSPSTPDLYFEDVMAAMGATGIGTLEIIPDDPGNSNVIIPEVSAHVYNVTPQGTIGSRVPTVAPSPWMRDDLPVRSLSIPPIQGNFRRNGGFRTLTKVDYFVTVNEPGQPSRHTTLRTVPASITVFGSMDDLFGGPVSPAARVTFHFLGGNAIAFYTYTENSTNDPTLVIRDPFESIDVSWGY